MSIVYVSLEEIKQLSSGRWKDSWDDNSESQIILASAKIRQKFKKYGLDLEENLENGKLEPVILKNIITQMLVRFFESLDSSKNSSNMPSTIDYTQFSMGAGPYNFGGTINQNSGNLYLTKENDRDLGLPGIIQGQTILIENWRDNNEY